MDLIGFLVVILIALLVLYCVRLLLRSMGLGADASQVVLIIVGLIFLLLALKRLGVMRRFW